MKKRIIWVLSLVLWLSISCHKQEEFIRPDLEQSKFLVGEVIKVSSSSCPLCERAVLPCAIKEEMEVEFYSALGSVFSEYGVELLKGRIEDKGEGKAGVEDWVKLARKVQANYLLIPVVYCYSERKGSGASASEPAEVGFHLHIYEVGSGKEVWAGDFRERQKALSENVLELNKFIKRKARWLKAEELLIEGAEEMLRAFLKASKKE